MFTNSTLIFSNASFLYGVHIGICVSTATAAYSLWKRSSAGKSRFYPLLIVGSVLQSLEYLACLLSFASDYAGGGVPGSPLYGDPLAATAFILTVASYVVSSFNCAILSYVNGVRLYAVGNVYAPRLIRALLVVSIVNVAFSIVVNVMASRTESVAYWEDSLGLEFVNNRITAAWMIYDELSTGLTSLGFFYILNQLSVQGAHANSISRDLKLGWRQSQQQKQQQGVFVQPTWMGTVTAWFHAQRMRVAGTRMRRFISAAVSYLVIEFVVALSATFFDLFYYQLDSTSSMYYLTQALRLRVTTAFLSRLAEIMHQAESRRPQLASIMVTGTQSTLDPPPSKSLLLPLKR
ncbi:hypothetical protein BC828DRAFT_382510 [Blastocladiella britannica]|nr:hypothetical protein BC828DRAFT_382510 [Blastocladiella britannica]